MSKLLFRTSKGAERWVKRTFPNVHQIDLEGANPLLINRAFRQIYSLSLEYPAATRWLSRVALTGSTKVRNAERASNNAYMSVAFGNELFFGSRYFRADSTVDLQDELDSTEDNMLRLDVEMIATHEFGHLVQPVLERPPTRERFHSWLQEWWIKHENVECDLLSEYACTDIDEFFAEAFVAMTHYPLHIFDVAASLRELLDELAPALKA